MDRLAQAERAPQARLQREQVSIANRKTAYGAITTQLSLLQNRVDDLSNPDLFNRRTATASDETLATVSAAAGSAIGSYAFHILQRAAAASRLGTASVSTGISTTADVSSLTLNKIPLGNPISAGTFTVNGKMITVEATDPLQAVFDRIAAATDDITASYDPTTDKITLNSASNAEIVLGSAADSSNFLQALRLSNAGTSSVTSASRLGTVQLGNKLSEANLLTAVTGDGLGQGKMDINGVEIAYDTTKDNLGGILARINSSEAGVTASYDPVNGRFSLTNKITGDVGIAAQDVTGNFLAATGLQGGSLQRGKDLQYTLNGGGTLTSHSNTISAESSGITGLAVEVLKSGDFSVEIGNDTTQARDAIKNFVSDYNKVQALIDTNTASTTDAKGHVTAGTLAGESEAYTLASELRRIVSDTFTFATGASQRLDSFGVKGNGNDNTLALPSDADLDKALAGNATGVQAMFTTGATGLNDRLAGLLDRVVGTDGTLIAKQDSLTKQSTAIDDNILEQEKQVQRNRDQLITSFLAMEQAQQRTNQQLQFLSQRFGTSSA